MPVISIEDKMKGLRGMKSKLLGVFLCFCILFTLVQITALATENAAPTRTTLLDLNEYPDTTDMLDSEGWKWEPKEDGGTLTLRNCYIRTDSATALIFPTKSDISNYNVTINLEGTNILESTVFGAGALIQNQGVLPKNMNLTISGAEDAKLSLLTTWPDVFESAPTPQTVYPCGIDANSVTLKSGNLYANSTFCTVYNDINIMGGSLTVESNNIRWYDSAYFDCLDGLYSAAGNINISGGTVDLNVGRNGIYITGVNAADKEQAVYITGGDVTIRAGHASNSENCIGIAAKNIYIETDEPVNIYGRDTALAIWAANGMAEINKIGTEFALTKSETSTFRLIYQRDPDTNPISICDANYDGLDTAIHSASLLDPELYKDFSAVTNAVSAANSMERNKTAIEQPQVAAIAQAITDAIAALEYKDADYSAVDEAIAAVERLNPDHYIDFSAVQKAVDAVVRGKNFTEQSAVDDMAQAILNAVSGLEYKSADYSAVDETIAKANALDPDDYVDFSAVETAVSEVVRGKNITDQDEVDDMALAIENAIANLERKPAAARSNSEQASHSEDTPDGSAADSPQTGDDGNIAFWAFLMLAAGATLAGTILYSRKKKYS